MPERRQNRRSTDPALTGFQVQCPECGWEGDPVCSMMVQGRMKAWRRAPPVVYAVH
jgi:hypothetical protein